jgi:hypothetical protein
LLAGDALVAWPREKTHANGRRYNSDGERFMKNLIIGLLVAVLGLNAIAWRGAFLKHKEQERVIQTQTEIISAQKITVSHLQWKVSAQKQILEILEESKTLSMINWDMLVEMGLVDPTNRGRVNVHEP